MNIPSSTEHAEDERDGVFLHISGPWKIDTRYFVVGASHFQGGPTSPTYPGKKLRYLRAETAGSLRHDVLPRVKLTAAFFQI